MGFYDVSYRVIILYILALTIEMALFIHIYYAYIIYKYKYYLNTLTINQKFEYILKSHHLTYNIICNDYRIFLR